MTHNTEEHTRQFKLWKTFLINISLLISLFAFGVLIGFIVRNERLINNEIRDRAKSHFQNIVLTRRWNAVYNGVYVEKTEGIESNP